MTARRTTTTAPVVATRQRGRTTEIAAWCIGGAFLLSMCATKAEDMSASGTAKATAVVGTGAGAAGLGAGAGAFAAYCLKFPKACQNMGKGRTKEEPIITPATQPPVVTAPPVTAPRPTVPLPVMPTPTIRGRPVVPPAPSIPTAPTAVPVIPGKAPTRATICTPIFTPLPGGSVGGGGQVCS
jgi:hypothetical protein